MKNRLFALLLVCFVCLMAIAHFGRSQAQSPNQVGLVVSYGNGQVWSGCVAIPASSATGLDVLQNSGLTLTLNYSPIGAAVCKIGDVGCPADDCFCKSPPDNWNYWHLQGGGWTYSNLGASNATVNSGAVEGWSWGNSSSAQPPLLTFDQICAAPVAPTATQVPPTATTAPSDTPLPPTDTAAPSKTPIPLTNTARPSKTPLPLAQTLAPSDTPSPTQTTVADSPTLEEQTAVSTATPSSTPQIEATIQAVAKEISTAQAETAASGSSKNQVSDGMSSAGDNGSVNNSGQPDLGKQLTQNGYPIFGILLIGLGILLAIMTRRKRR